MKKVLALLAVVAMAALVLGAAACSDGDTQTAATLTDDSPQGILQASVAASEELTSATGTFEATLTVPAGLLAAMDIATTDTSAAASESVTLTGTFSAAKDAQAGDISMTLSLGGEATNVGLRFLADTMWFQLGGQWYDAPPELAKVMSEPEAGDTSREGEVREILVAAGIDPAAWINDLRLAEEEKVDGIDAYHLVGSADVAKAMAAIMSFAQDEEAMKALGSSSNLDSLQDVAGPGGITPPDPSLFAGMEEQLATVLQEPTVDLWIAKGDLAMLRFSASAKIVPPASEEGQDTGESTPLLINMSLVLRDHNQPVAVEAPVDVKPYGELERILDEDPVSVLGPLGAMMGMGEGMGDGDVTEFLR